MASIHYHSRFPRLLGGHIFSEFITASNMDQHSRVLSAIFLIAMVQFASLGTPVMACLYCPKSPPPATPSPPTSTPPVPATPSPATPSPPTSTPPVPATPSPPTPSPPATASPPTPSPPATASPPSSSGSCPIDALKLGLCLDVLGGLVHLGIGNSAENQCCPVLQGVLSLEAALCLCEAIKLKALSLNIILPLALELLVSCGKSVPPGFTCPSQS